MTDGNTYAINKHLDDQEDFDALQEVTAELEQTEVEAKKYHDAWLEAEAKIVELQDKLAKLERWQAAAFVAHGNLDLDIEANPEALAEMKGDTP